MKITGKTKKLQPFQAYTKLYHESKLKAIIEEKFKEHQENVPQAEQKARFAFATSLTKEMYASETDKVKAEVEAYRHRLAEGDKIKLEYDDDDDDDGVDDEAQERMNQQMQL